MVKKEKAVVVRGISKQYGQSKKAQLVLDRLDMTVDKGTIYGLLGASGCGKTTLLNCIVGRRSIKSGEIWVLGGRPGSRSSGVPGPRVGYMPQEIALMREFTVGDAVYHFGWIYGMSNDRIEARLQFLTKLLELPPANTTVKNLSGGQQRRVSLAVSLVHDPELLILDEPTVGLDPVLRQTIWGYLTEIATKHNKTIIITTHYIEEARQANRIGLMRNGKLMAEDSPESLLRIFNCSSVEEVFLRLSASQEKFRRKENGALPVAMPDANGICPTIVDDTREPFEMESVVVQQSEPPEDIVGKSYEVHEFVNNTTYRQSPEKKFFHNLKNQFRVTTKGHIKALMSKNWYRITRHPGAIVFVFLFPMLELTSFYLSVGGMPQGLKIGVVNEELGNFSSCEEYKAFLGEDYGGRSVLTEDGLPYCLMQGLSCKFLESFDDDVGIKVSYPTLEAALKDGKAGKLIAVIHFVENYSAEFEARIDLGGDASNETVENSELPIRMDMSQHQSALLLERQLRDIHRDHLRQIFQDCHIAPKVGAIPLNFQNPIYGSVETNFSTFMTPGVVTSMVFFLAVSVTATIIVVERLDGVWDRTLLAGVSSAEILLSHVAMETLIIFLQVVEVIIFVFYVFSVPCVGSHWDYGLLLVLQGFCGMCGGFLVSVSCDSVSSSNFISMGSFYPLLILSGLLWPIEGMPEGLKWISAALPTTHATTALRNIMEKGWRLTRNHVYQGYLISIIWIFVFCICSLLVIRIKK